ncbi:hypothetical protein PybrP1_002693 [[Pythium] brassicae (nom. inval.)]|nr:hypothetical protein PybrP1_002693 [[Pythium] brassicae (nom. inval.)]
MDITVLITSATRGIGLALARLYAVRGWKVVGAARDQSKAQQLLPGETIELLINNAGILVRTDMVAATKSDFMHTLEV